MAQTPVMVGAALQYTQSVTNSETETYDYNPTITTSVSQLLPNNADRLELIIFNLGANDGYVHWDGAVSSTNGFKVNANGGFLLFKVKDDFTLVARQFFAVSTIGNTTFTVVEVVRITALPGVPK